MATMQPELTAAFVAEAAAAVLTDKDVARMLNLSRDNVRAMQLSHDGPVYTERDGYIRYSLRAVRVFQNGRAAAHRALMASYGERCAQ